MCNFDVMKYEEDAFFIRNVLMAIEHGITVERVDAQSTTWALIKNSELLDQI